MTNYQGLKLILEHKKNLFVRPFRKKKKTSTSSILFSWIRSCKDDLEGKGAKALNLLFLGVKQPTNDQNV